MNKKTQDTQASIETITPQQAKEYLEHNRCNRKISFTRVKELARKIKEGKYVMPPDAIAFDKTGRLFNGQHRLTACVEAGIAIQSIVYRNADESVFMVTDIGMKKSGGQALNTIGYSNSTNLAALARIVYVIETTPDHVHWWNNSDHVDPTDIIDTIKAYPELQEYITFACTATKSTRANKLNAPATGVGAAIHIAAKAGHREDIEHLITTTTEAVGLQDGDPELAIMKAFSRDIIKKQGSNTLMRTAITCALLLKALNAKIQGRSIQIVRWNAHEQFPTVESKK